MDQVQCVRPFPHRTHHQPAIERGQPPPVRCGQRQQISIVHLRGVQEPGKFDGRAIQKADIVRPEGVPGQCAQRRQRFRNNRRSAKRICLARVAQDSQNRVLRERTGRKPLAPNGTEPAMCHVVVNVPVIDQSDQHIDVQQKSHGHSSRRRFTISIVTGLPPGRLGSSGTPLRVRNRRRGGSRPFLASTEITSPTLFPSLSASPLAAARTSSSMASVVLTHQSSRISHHASVITHQSSRISHHASNIARQKLASSSHFALCSFQLPASSFQLPASSFQLPASSFQLPASSFQLPACPYFPHRPSTQNTNVNTTLIKIEVPSGKYTVVCFPRHVKSPGRRPSGSPAFPTSRTTAPHTTSSSPIPISTRPNSVISAPPYPQSRITRSQVPSARRCHPSHA
jgi:hypothetical protein